MELEFVEWLEREFGTHRKLEIGIGDDAALLNPFGDEFTVVTHDTLIDKVHFDLDQHAPGLAGRKALAVNLSDLAAMAAQPVAILVGLVIPKAHGLEMAREIFEGMRPLLDEFSIAVAGGDTNSSDGPLTIGITAIGKRSSSEHWRRDGAKVGDQLIVTGELGGSILGRHLSFAPRIWEAIMLSQRHQINAAIDISDGLLLDLHRVCLASSCAAELNLQHIPVSIAASEVSKSQGGTALDHALADGEDFELLISVSPETWLEMCSDKAIDFPITRIGETVEGTGLTGIDENGTKSTLKPQGFVHGI